jgi:exodeoxyribonuclease V gamma subunit
VLYLSWCGQDPRDNSRREPSALVAELLDVATDCHGASDESARQAVRAALVVRHALQPFSPAAFGAAHVDEAMPDGDAGEPRRFSFDARWRDAAETPPALRTEPAFAPAALRLAGETREDVVSIDRLRSTLVRPHATYLRDGLGLRLPEDEPPLDDHEPLGTPNSLDHYHLRETVFRAWLQEGARPQADRLQQHLLARAQLAPGADGRATVEALLGEVAPFASLALDGGFGSDERRIVVDEPVAGRVLRGALAGVHGATESRLLRVALRAKGRHGNLVLRHGLDWLVASLLQLPVYELYREKEGEAPRLVPRVLATRDQARAALASLISLHEQALREPLPFLPKSGHAYHAAGDETRGLRAAAQQWRGDERNHVGAERSPATQMALRGRDPFVDDDARSRARFQEIARAVFAAVERAEPFALEDLP